jgi:acyl dehydratase
MALNKECVGKEYPPITAEVTLEALQRYARAYNDDNPFYFDEHKPGGIVAPPMFGVVVTWQSVMQAVADPQVKADLLRLLHGEQDIEFIRPMRPGDVLSSKAKILSIDEKATGETMVVELTASNKNDEPVQRILFTVFIRGGGGSGKTRVAEQRTPEAQRSILFEVNQTIDKDQTYRYAEASGDRNPIHVDENVAKMAGLPGIIVHGLCTMAFTSKAVIDQLCGGDPKRLKRLRVRFARPVLPGQTITTRIWQEGSREGREIYGYETYNPQGQAVIRGGIAEVAS